MFETLLMAAVKAFIGLLVKAGFEDEIKDIKLKLTGGEEKKRRRALEKAYASAQNAVDDDNLNRVLSNQSVNEVITTSMLDDAAGGPDQKALALAVGEAYPKVAGSMQRFMLQLKLNLWNDATWGPILQSLMSLRLQAEINTRLRELNLHLTSEQLTRRLSGELRGSGALAQGDGAKAVGERGLLIEGNVDKIVQIFIDKLAITETASEGSDRERYLKEISKEANRLPWAHVHAEFAKTDEKISLRLSDIYTPLDTSELPKADLDKEEKLRQILREKDRQRISAQEALNAHQRLLILGDPGSGKSTFVKHLVYMLAQSNLSENPDAWLEQISPWKWGALLPMKVELRAAAAFAEKENSEGNHRLLLKFLRHDLGEAGLDGYWNQLQTAIEDNDHPMLILLDGLDEVATAKRQLIVDAVNDFVDKYSQHRYVVTCRPYAYVDQPWRLANFVTVTLAPFSPEQIDIFIGNWYDRHADAGTFTRKEATEKTHHLRQTVRGPDLQGLAERPLLLTVMAQLHTHTGQLPPARTQLYAESVDLLLERWERRMGKDKDILTVLNIPNLKMDRVETALYDVAYQAHEKASLEQETADIDEGQLTRWLKPYLNNDLTKAETFVAFIRERAGLLIRHKTAAFTFPHRTFQEFLAGCFLTTQRDFATRAVQLVIEDVSRWREVFLLGVGHAARSKQLGNAIDAANRLVTTVCHQSQQLGAQQLQMIGLAAEAINEIGLLEVAGDDLGRELLPRVQALLLHGMLDDRHIKPPDRASCGNSLVLIGDPRPGVNTLKDMQFCLVPAGSFVMGSDKNDDKDAQDSETPQKTIDIPDFYLSRFPVTQAQFAACVAAGGYANDAYWPEARELGYWKKGQFKGDYDSEPRDRPVRLGAPFDLANHPVVGVSWFEALAFVRWLNDLGNLIPSGWTASLPTEAQWEKAARGGKEIVAGEMIVKLSEVGKKFSFKSKVNKFENRIYPWGDKLSTNLANYDDTKIQATNTVGCFPRGASPYGCEEMSGNVWEWCRTKWRDNYRTEADESLDGKEDRVLRGGSYFVNPWGVRCSARGWFNPYFVDVSIGFRVALSPFTSGL
jgi:formylglycine-generating enzyme required for sulfatase activity/energy-coupling factor transporter ATP-binding protein EcfA2